MEPRSDGGKPTEDDQVRLIASAYSVRDFVYKGFNNGISKNSFDLILKAIMLEPRNYLLWDTRRSLLQAYGHSRKVELEYFRAFDKNVEAASFLKTSSQLWYHRFWLAKEIGPEAVKQEIDSLRNILVTNPDESCTWDVLQYIVERLGPHELDGEFEFVDKFLIRHPMNSGAWWYRLLLDKNPSHNRLKSFEFTKSFLLSNVNNDYAWNHRTAIVLMLDNNGLFKELEVMKIVFAQKHCQNEHVWLHRQFIAGAFPGNLYPAVADLEIQFSREALQLDMKNRYAWFHRRWVYETLKIINTEDEFKLTSDVIQQDVSNSLAWFQRKWLIKQFGGLEDELEFCNVILQIDLCCDSAWHQRAFILSEYGKDLSYDMREAEVRYAIRAIFQIPEKDFSWKYLMLLYMRSDYYDSMIDEVYSSLLSIILNVIRDIKDKRSLFVNVLGTLLQLICCGYQPSHCMGDIIALACSKAPGMMTSTGSEDSVCKFINSIGALLEYVDPLNAYFWEHKTSEAKICYQARFL